MQEDSKRYAHPVVRGVKYTAMLPRGAALVLEGGGTRGFYTSGVFEAFMDEGIMFPYIIGVSAGAANALTYIAGQRGRSRIIAEHYAGDPRYVGLRNLLLRGSIFGFGFMFDTIPNEYLFWDREMFEAADLRFLTGATDCETGEAVWFEKSDIEPDFGAVLASCSVPLISRVARFRGRAYMDGGVAAPIPIEKSIADGNTFHVVVLTRNAGYTKPPFEHRHMMKLVYRKYPKLTEAMLRRHEVYNRQLALCEQLEREGRALIIRPLKPLAVGRTASDTAKLLALYDEGHAEGAEAVKRMLEARERRG